MERNLKGIVSYTRFPAVNDNDKSYIALIRVQWKCYNHLDDIVLDLCSRYKHQETTKVVKYVNCVFVETIKKALGI